MDLHIDDLGPLAHGSNNFMYPYEAASGKVYLTTYGPRPARFYEIDPDTGEASFFEPGDYQLRMIAETSDGHLWTVSNYERLLYEFDPAARDFVNAYEWPVIGDNMICVADARDRLYTVKNHRLYSFDPQARAFSDHGLVMAEDSLYNRGQYAAFGPDGKLYVVADSSVFRYDPETEAVEQLLALEALGPDARILMGNAQAGPLDLPWLYGSAWILEQAHGEDQSARFSHHLLFRLNVESGQLDTCPMPVGEIAQKGVFFDPVDRLHYYCVPDRGSVTLCGFDWEQREVSRRIDLPYGDQAGFAAPASTPRHLWLCLPFLGRLLDVDLETGDHRLVFANPAPAEVRCLALTRGRRAFGVTYDCGHVFERSTDSEGPGESIGLSYLFRVCYGPAAVSRDRAWLAYPLNCANGVCGTGVLPTRGAAVGRHVSDLLPIHMISPGGDTFLIVHRGAWYTHQEEGRWDGTDETVSALAELGQGVIRLHAGTGKFEELPAVPCASLVPLAGGGTVGCDPAHIWRLEAGELEPQILCDAPEDPIRLAADPGGNRVLVASATALYEVDVTGRALRLLIELPFAPVRGLFYFHPGRAVLVGEGRAALYVLGESVLHTWSGKIPGKVGPVAAPDEPALYTVDHNLTRLRWA